MSWGAFRDFLAGAVATDIAVGAGERYAIVARNFEQFGCGTLNRAAKAAVPGFLERVGGYPSPGNSDRIALEKEGQYGMYRTVDGGRRRHVVRGRERQRACSRDGWRP